MKDRVDVLDLVFTGEELLCVTKFKNSNPNIEVLNQAKLSTVNNAAIQKRAQNAQRTPADEWNTSILEFTNVDNFRFYNGPKCSQYRVAGLHPLFSDGNNIYLICNYLKDPKTSFNNLNNYCYSELEIYDCKTWKFLTKIHLQCDPQFGKKPHQRSRAEDHKSEV